MDWQLFLAMNVMVVSVVVALLALRLRYPGYPIVVASHGFVLAAGLLAWWFRPTWLLPAVLIPFVPFVGVPTLLNHLKLRAEKKRDTQTLARLTRWMGWLYPTRAGSFAAELSLATRHSNDATLDAALAAVEAARTTDDERAIVQALRAAYRGDWAAALAATERADDPHLMVRTLKIRALGERGRIDEMVQAYETAKTRLIGEHAAEALLFVFAFTGHADAVDRLLNGALKTYPAETRNFWIARTRLRADPGDMTAAVMLDHLSVAASRERSRLAAARARVEAPAPLSPALAAAVGALDARLVRDQARRAVPLKRLYATVALIALNLVVFAYSEWTGSSEDMRHLWTLGALWPPSITQRGEWWRLATATVLHFGLLHLAANMFMLLVFGRLVETRIGSLLTALLYTVAAVGSSAAVYALMRYGIAEEGVLVGASGAIFGLVGLSLALDIKDWLVSRDRLDRARIGSLLVVLSLQAVIDNMIPNVSFAGHTSGLVIGLLLGGALALLQHCCTKRNGTTPQ